MVAMSKPILTVLNSQYPERENISMSLTSAMLSESMNSLSFRDIAAKPQSGFSFHSSKEEGEEGRVDKIQCQR